MLILKKRIKSTALLELSLRETGLKLHNKNTCKATFASVQLVLNVHNLYSVEEIVGRKGFRDYDL